MTFQQLFYIAEVARCGSFNRAAQNLYLSQSSISNAVKELEDEMHIRIFQRSNRGVELTAEGKEFLSYAHALLEQKQHIESIYQSETVKPTVHFSVATQRYPFAVDAFIRLLGEVKNPRFSFTIKETGMYSVIDDVYNSMADLGVIFTSNMTEKLIRRLLDTKNLEFHEIEKIQPRVFMREGHPLSGKAFIAPGDLEGWIFMTFEHDLGASLAFSEEIHLLSFKQPERVIHINDRATATNIIVNSDVITLGSGLLLENFVDQRMISIPLEDNTDKMKLGWIKQKNRGNSPEAEEFIRLLEQTIRDAIQYTEQVRLKILDQHAGR